MAKKSLVSEAAPESTALTVPAFGAEGAVSVPVAPTFQQVPYAFFASMKSPKWATLAGAIPGLMDSDPVLQLPDPEPPVKLSPFTFYLLKAKQFWGDFSDTGELLRASFEKQDRPYQEVIETALVVIFGGRATFATCRFKGTKAPAAHTAVKTLELVTEPRWAELSPDHKATLQMPDPRFRFLTTCSMQPRTSRSTTRKYVVTVGKTSPTKPADWDALTKFFADPKVQPVMVAVSESFNRHIQEVTEKVKA